jgi:hypothetical protein
MRTVTIIDRQDASTTIESKELMVGSSYGYAVEVFWDNTVDGVVYLEASVCNRTARPEEIIWVKMSDTQLNTLGNQGRLWNRPQIMYNWVRCKFVPNVGSTGTLTAIICTKDV